jgi:hypothetical protein
MGNAIPKDTSKFISQKNINIFSKRGTLPTFINVSLLHTFLSLSLKGHLPHIRQVCIGHFILLSRMPMSQNSHSALFKVQNKTGKLKPSSTTTGPGMVCFGKDDVSWQL